MINSIKGSSTVNQADMPKEKQKVSKSETVRESKDEAAILELSKPSEKSAVYKKPVKKEIDIDEINRLWEQSQKSYESLRKIVENLISKQGKKLEDLLAGKDVLLIDNETRAAATEAISENGEWGVKAVSERIVAFAKAASGNDNAKVGKLRNAIEKGFREAEKAFGGKLPDISRDTYKEVMRQLDEWEKE